MSDIIKMDYPAMEDMANTFRDGAQTLEDLSKRLENMAGRMEGGVLLGKGGDAFQNNLRSRLVARIKKLQAKFEELQGDVWGALVDLRDGDHEAGSRFKG